MRRRDFLGRTATLAGGAALASVLPAEQLVSAAAKVQSRVRAAEPAQHADRHLRRADDGEPLLRPLLRLAPAADARNSGLAYPDADGNQVTTHRLTPDFQGCAFRDPDHSWDGGRHQWGRGKMNGFVQGNAEGDGSDEFAAGYYLKEDLPFIPHAARQLPAL